MIHAVSLTLAEWLTKERAISENDRPLFAYAVYSLLFGLSPMLIAIILGLIFNMLCEGVVMIIPFIIIRKFSGGQHLKSSVSCFIISTCLLTVAFHAMQSIFKHRDVCVLSVIVLASIISICIFSPIESPSRKISPTQANFFRFVARILSVVFGCTYFLFVAIGNKNMAIPLGVGIAIPAVLQLPCLFLGSQHESSV